MKFGALTIASVAALAVAACTKHDEATTTTTNTTVAADASPNGSVTTASDAMSPGQTFANTAAASDTFEIETSRAALTAASSPAIKTFAKAMIDAHTKSTAQLKAAASAASPAIIADPTLSAEQQGVVSDLSGKTGAAFDAAYVAAQRTAHQRTLNALKSYSASGDVASLKTFATELVPTVTSHLNMAKGLRP